jgi:hypothetical protein
MSKWDPPGFEKIKNVMQKLIRKGSKKWNDIDVVGHKMRHKIIGRGEKR